MKNLNRRKVRQGFRADQGLQPVPAGVPARLKPRRLFHGVTVPAASSRRVRTQPPASLPVAGAFVAGPPSGAIDDEPSTGGWCHHAGEIPRAGRRPPMLYRGSPLVGGWADPRLRSPSPRRNNAMNDTTDVGEASQAPVHFLKAPQKRPRTLQAQQGPTETKHCPAGELSGRTSEELLDKPLRKARQCSLPALALLAWTHPMPSWREARSPGERPHRLGVSPEVRRTLATPIASRSSLADARRAT